VATGKYRGYIEPLWESARRYFLPGTDVRLFVFGDAPPLIDGEFIATEHRPWPGPTLFRYHAVLAARRLLSACDYVFHCDADMRFVAPVGQEILGELTAVVHPGFADRPPEQYTYERRPESRAYIAPGAGRHYVAGGFQGGRTEAYLAAMEAMRAAIDEDARHGLVAVWHDESHWNRYCLDHPPDVVLPPTYCCPESWPMPGRKVLALDKDHKAMRA
jgi:histo-blood group ABO system transferase